MSETTQGYFTLGGETEQTNPGFQSTLDYIRETARNLILLNPTTLNENTARNSMPMS